MTAVPGRAPTVSVVVVSRHRPQALARCLAALTLQDHPAFEVVLVADGGSILIRPDLRLRRVAFDIANISRARNAGVMAATGDVIAFIDDDAVAEPGWLRELTAPFADAGVITATGCTRGPDGIRWQARAARIGADGLDVPLDLTGDRTLVLVPDAIGPVSALGTNCAFRREALAGIGGVDPIFPYHLDESDVSWRLAAHHPQAATAIVPRAEVTHGLADHAGRRGNVPRDLSMQGRSIALFCRRHGGPLGPALTRHERALMRAMVDGALDPLALPRVRQSLHDGVARGLSMALPAPPAVPLAPAPCTRVTLDGTGPRAAEIMVGWLWQAPRLRARAARAAAAGRIVTILMLTPTFLPFREDFTGRWWERRGGLWGGEHGAGRADCCAAAEGANRARIGGDPCPPWLRRVF